MKTKHTPSPWYTDTAGQGDITVTSTHDKHGSDQDVCEVYGASDEEQAANAALIAAAPDLLAALEACMDMKEWDDSNGPEAAAYDRASAAIAKATNV